MSFLNDTLLSFAYKLIFCLMVLYFFAIAWLPWSGMHLFAEDRAAYYAEWRSFTTSTVNTVRRLCEEDGTRTFVFARDDKTAGFLWHELQVDCPVVRTTEVTALPPELFRNCEVVLVNESYDPGPDRTLIAHSQSATGAMTKDYSVHRECVPS